MFVFKESGSRRVTVRHFKVFKVSKVRCVTKKCAFVLNFKSQVPVETLCDFSKFQFKVFKSQVCDEKVWVRFEFQK